MKNFSILIVFLLTLNLGAQEIKDVTPLSPNAAAMAKYGEIPVGYFTGIPNINIPLYSIRSGNLSLPLSLSYHAGGNKVETIPSWVGLGWSLQSVPIISRVVRGLPDEKPGGFFTVPDGYSLEEIYNEPITLYRENIALKQKLFSNEIDSEPDIFSYSLIDESGKFFFDQQSGKFITFPHSNIKIEWIDTNNGIFEITSSKGVKYVFSEVEKNGISSDAVTTSWNISEISNNNGIDKISFDYYPDFMQLFETNGSITKYVYLGGSSSGCSPESIFTNQVINTTYPKLLQRIDYDGGYIEFVKSSQTREDLPQGGYTLDTIKIFKDDQNILSYGLDYSYLIGSGCVNQPVESKKWLQLDQVNKISSHKQEILPYILSYKTQNVPPCRTSSAQDYWGFYNGKNSNENIIPPIVYSTMNGPQEIPGADRRVDSRYSDFGIIRSITYPTGGRTEFEFENNEAYSSDLPTEYKDNVVILSGDDIFEADQDIPIETEVWTEDFIIDNEPDPVLNGEHPEGGAFINLTIDNYGCDLSGGSDPCATFVLRGTTALGDNIYYYVDMDKNFHLPNGSYNLFASFNQEPPLYEGFIFMIDWKTEKDQEVKNTLVGGLRIKEIRNYTDIGSEPIIKTYSYMADSLVETKESGIYDAEQSMYISSDEFIETGIAQDEKWHYESAAFVINSHGGSAMVDINIINQLCDSDPNNNNCVNFKLKGVSYSNTSFDTDITEGDLIELTNGEYVIYANLDHEPFTYQGISCSLSWINEYIQTITHPRVYQYDVEGENLYSSGDVFGNLNFYYSDAIAYTCYEYDPKGLQIENTRYYLRIKSSPLTQQISHSGSFIGYGLVVEKVESADTNGFTVYKFSNKRDREFNGFPYKPAESNELLRGQLLEKKTYKYLSGSYSLIEEYTAEYSSVPYDLSDSNQEYSFGIKWGNLYFSNDPSSRIKYRIAQYLSGYKLYGGWNKLSKETTVSYFDTGSIVNIKNYHYDNGTHLYPTRIETNNSRGYVMIQQNMYPQDYNTSLNYLISNNVLNVPIDSRTYVDAVLTSGNQIEYNDFGQPVATYTYEIGDTTLFDPADPYTFSPKKEVNYNSNGRVEKVVYENGIVNYFVWAHNNQYPVVKIETSDKTIDINLAQKTIDSVDITMFGSDTDIASNQNQASTIRDALSNLLNDRGLVTVYTYSIFGLVSVTDANGFSTYYDYDTFGRLKSIKDHNGFILKQHEYNYKSILTQ